MARVLVTGGTGFIGRHLVASLTERGHDVTCLVRDTSSPGSLEAMGVRLVVGDVTESKTLLEPVAEAEVVYHLAAMLKMPWRKDFATTNTEGTRNVAATCAGCARVPTLVVVSSLAACGPSRDGQPLTEEKPPAPVSRYGRVKLEGERAAAAFAGEAPITIVRPAAVFGEADLTVYRLFKMVWRGWCLVPSLRPRKLSIIHATDLANVLIRSAEAGERLPDPKEADPTPGQGVYFAAYPDPLTLAELGRQVARALGRHRPMTLRIPSLLVWVIAFFGEMIGRLRNRPTLFNLDKARESAAGSWICDSAKARRELGFEPESKLRDRLEQTGDWYRAKGWLGRKPET